ncbi:glycosyltransferase 87 family protein [Streptomyces sp. NBC_00237]|uniref:glycosyltransferase 87 family protein n=1 Tax=Streptomyces sp. NBC_00237 TaxID=2975687 RepID=UPI0022591328|nr:glycosyltransferase 87 family protein [Streptomyces sp. NBC_00237]MCX5201265.1 glycosyltransferase 87 family protein [Streptomyces sp. NBC_00237]
MSTSRFVTPALAHNDRARPPAVVAGAVCLLSFATFWAAQRFARVSMIDLTVYRAEGATVLSGGDLYAMRVTAANLPTTYPPFAALLFTPLSLSDLNLLRVLATAGNLALLVALVHLSLRLAGGSRPKAALWSAAAAVWCEPVWTTLRYGQINLAVAVAVLWDLTRKEEHRWAGVGIGLATAVKITPGLFVVFLLLAGLSRGRRAGAYRDDPWLRQAAVAVVAFLAATVGSAVLLPRDSHTFWTRALFDSSRVGNMEDTANQSLGGVLARLLHTGAPGAWWGAVAALVAVMGLYTAVDAALRGDRARAALTCAVTALLISPISWSHHWVWCVPLIAFLAVRAAGEGRGRKAGAWTAGAVFFSYALWAVPHGRHGRSELDQDLGQFVLSASYPVVGLAFVLAGFGLTNFARTYMPGGRDSWDAHATHAHATGEKRQARAKE